MSQAPTFSLGKNPELNLDATLTSGQTFRWHKDAAGRWTGILGTQVVRVSCVGDEFFAQTFPLSRDLTLLRHYFQLHVSLSNIVQTFPDDPLLRKAQRKYFGLRLLRQDPWETLASFILSSSKRIEHIRQIVAAICEKLGEPIQALDDSIPQRLFFSFPSPVAIATSTPKHLRACKAGFRAEYLWKTAHAIVSGRFDFTRLFRLSYADAHRALTTLPGVGDKIADCVLLFAYGRQEAFPMDVWIERALRRFYFRGKRSVSRQELNQFRRTHFGPWAGYAQQYLFHYVRSHPKVVK